MNAAPRRDGEGGLVGCFEDTRKPEKGAPKQTQCSHAHLYACICTQKKEDFVLKYQEEHIIDSSSGGPAVFATASLKSEVHCVCRQFCSRLAACSATATFVALHALDGGAP